jgi:signal transduction histidine kinase
VTVRTPDSALESMERRYAAAMRMVAYPLLAVPFIPYVLTQAPPLSSLLITVGIVVGAAVWVTWGVVLNPCSQARPRLAGIYFVGFVVVAAVLIARSPWFAFFTWLGYVQSMQYLRAWWRWVGLMPLAFLMAVAQAGGFHKPTLSVIATYLVLAAVNAVIVAVFAHVGQHSEEQNQVRKGMIAELAETNDRLERTLAENAELHARLMEQAKESGVLAERQRMAREIHDTIAQSLAGIITQLAATRDSGTREDREARRVQTAERLAREALAEARRSVRAMQPLALANAGLPEAVADVAARWSADSGVAAEVSTTGTARPLRPDVAVTLLRVTQEALSNVAKHAAAEHAWVTLSYMEDEVTLDIRDDGHGFAGPTTGFGLVTMRDRVCELAGELAVESEQGTGTAVSARVPA